MSQAASIPVTITVNGQAVRHQVPPQSSLLTFLREHCGLTGTKRGCEEGECGACSVLVGGKLVDSCLIFAAEVEGQSVRTVEGLGTAAHLAPVQAAFAETGASQCGFCIPGMLIAATALLEAETAPDEAAVRKAISGNLCRCTGYDRIVRGILLAAELRNGESHNR